MRIGLVSPYSWSVPGGVNDHVANLAAQLEARGHEVFIMAPTGGAGHARSRHVSHERFISVGIATPFKSNGSKAYCNPSPFMLLRMKRLLRKMNFDVVHLHEPCTPSVSASAVLQKPLELPMVGTFHAALDDSPLYRHLYSLADRIIASLAVRIAVSEAAKEYVALRFPGEYRIIPNGVPVESYLPARRGMRTPGRIVFIGRAEPRKGVMVLLRAFKEVRERLPEATLVMVGPRWAQVQELVSRPGSGLEWPMPGIAALGRVSHESKLKEMSRAEVMCVPSLEGESFGIVLAEAMAAGLPLVASDLPGYRSVLRDGELGELTPVGGHTALADALCRLLSDSGRRAEFSRKGIEAAEELSWNRVAERVLETYDSAIEYQARVVAASR